MTPLNPSKRVKTAKKVCREAERAPWVAILTVFINFQGDVLYFHEKENKFLIAWYIIFEFYGSGTKNQAFTRTKQAKISLATRVLGSFYPFWGVYIKKFYKKN